MIKDYSLEFRTFFLLQFTKELLRQSCTNEIADLAKILKEKEAAKIFVKKRKEIIKEKKQKIMPQKVLPPVRRAGFAVPRKLIIPAPKLPKRFAYLKPTLTNVRIDLNKLDPLIKDPLVKSVICDGPDENIQVKGTFGAKKTGIILSSEEIDGLLKKFSHEAKIPIGKGIFRVAVGNLVLSAITSDAVGSKFVINKI